MSLIHCSGFDMGSLVDTEVLSGTSPVSTATGYNSGKYLRCSASLTGTSSARIRRFDSTTCRWATIGAGSIGLGFHFYGATLPASGEEQILRIRSVTPSLKAYITITSAGALKIYNAAGTLTATSSNGVIAAGQWYWVTITLTSSATVGAIEIKVNNSSVLSSSGINTAAADVDQIELGKIANISGQTVDFYYDNFVIDNTATHPTECWVSLVVPTSDGSPQSWAPSAGLDGYAMIDDAASASDPDQTDYVLALAASTDGRFNLPMVSRSSINLSPRSIIAIMPFYMARLSAAGGAPTVTLGAVLGRGDALASPALSLTTTNTAYAYFTTEAAALKPIVTDDLSGATLAILSGGTYAANEVRVTFGSFYVVSVEGPNGNPGTQQRLRRRRRRFSQMRMMQ